MSANIERRNGRDSMAYRAKTGAPWHGLGQTLPDNPSLAEVISAAQLDYRVALRPCYQRQSDGIFVPIEDKYAIYRTDTEDALGVVGERYTPIQNTEAFSWLEAFTGLTYDTAGALGRGERAWIMAAFDELDFYVADRKSERIQNNLLITTTHDGSGSVMVAMTPTRVVCQNTLTVGLRGASRLVKIRHTKNWSDKLAEAERVMALNRKHSWALIEACDRLALTPMSRDEAVAAFAELVPGDATRSANIRGELLSLFEFGTGNRGETRWDWLNAVTEYSDHTRTVRGQHKAEQRFKSAVLDGSAVAFKQRAFDLVVA
jgi:phage/plasmid-like protein (TIGR03299 family)